ncbi:keratin, type I cytoskeletal 9-like isoform X2 [Selaginella moellendorffii]|uniref:keratin, type I cytoskeletal 9-like isoform X2 n=1 Tax=Selaginella moellendorffii TaxID=88036 RepID=UPI000D1C7107|nr:keratin, type I cytoskeletal 9-like isoform X2 [Selaginella moellendorffii]|eukprot:XP_024530962.1 keratin, type I cytoskeletal 9-like isoform X2 [Selaginella moellendorffii]
MELPGGNSQDGSSGSQRSSSDPTARSSDRGGGSSASGSGDSYHYQPAASGSSGSQPAGASNSGSGSRSGSYGPAENSGSGSGLGYYQDAQLSGSGSGSGGAGSGSGSGSGGYYQGVDHSGSGSGSSGRYYQPAEGSSSPSGSHQAVDAGSYGSGSHRPGGSSSEHHSSSETKQTSSSRTGSSSVTWHETVDAPKLSEEDEASRRSSSLFGEEISKSTTDSNRSSLRRFKEGSKMFAGFIEDADGLQPSDDMLPPMTWEEKCEIIEELCLALEKRLDRLKNDKDGILDGLKNYFDVAEHTCGMARKDRVEMQRNVIQFAELLNPSKKPYSEDMLRILDKRLLKEKLQQRIKRLEKMVATATVQLESKLDVRELLHDSDFKEMRNLNEDLANQLDARARLLDKSRHVSRKIAQAAKALREEMDSKAVAKVSMRQSLTDRSPLVGKLQDLITSEYKEKDRLHLELLAFVKGEDLRPTAIEYMKIKQRSKSIRRELYNWLAKVEIAEMKHSQLTKNIVMLETETTASNSVSCLQLLRTKVSHGLETFSSFKDEDWPPQA